MPAAEHDPEVGLLEDGAAVEGTDEELEEQPNRHGSLLLLLATCMLDVSLSRMMNGSMYCIP